MHPRQSSRRRFLAATVAGIGGVAASRVASGPVALHSALTLAAERRATPRTHSADALALGPPPIISRAEWGADESLRRERGRFWPVERIVIHHTTIPTDGDWAGHVREVYRQHLKRDDGRWGDVGYHFLIDPAGHVYEGRWARDYADGEVHDGHDLENRIVQGVHVEGHNAGTVGVALMGDFRWSRPTIPALAGLVGVSSWLCHRHGLDPLAARTIVGHKNLGQTACPGGEAYALIPELRQWVADRLATTWAPA